MAATLSLITSLMYNLWSWYTQKYTERELQFIHERCQHNCFILNCRKVIDKTNSYIVSIDGIDSLRNLVVVCNECYGKLNGRNIFNYMIDSSTNESFSIRCLCTHNDVWCSREVPKFTGLKICYKCLHGEHL